MKIIVTRPMEDGESLKQKLHGMGHHVNLLPLIEIVPRKNVLIAAKNYQAICLTSANGVRALQNIVSLQNVPVITVGEYSMKAALTAGFLSVIAKGGDVLGLLDYVVQHVNPSDGPLLYLSGAETSGDLEGKLKHASYDVDRVIVYDAKAANLDGQSAQISEADAVLLYSPRSAKIWRSEVERLHLESIVQKLKHFCLSANVAAALPQSWHRSIAENPVEKDILALLDYSGKAE